MLRRFAREAMTQIELRYGNEHQRQINEQLNEDRKNLARELERSELERDEVIHRVKNDLNQVLSLLRLQKNDFLDESSKSVLQTAEARIHCFSSLYHKLEEARHTDVLNIRNYLEEIMNNLSQIFEEECGDVAVSIAIEDVDLSSSIGLKFGLALNELVTNAYQHVFMQDKGDRLKIEFQEYDDFYELAVSDNGPGMMDSERDRSKDQHGLKVIRALIESEQDGEIQEDFTDGSRFVIRFTKE